MKADKQEGQQRIKEHYSGRKKKRECGNLIWELDLNLNWGV